MPFQFFSEDCDFQLDNKPHFESWLDLVLKSTERAHGEINYIFCSDDYLLVINKTHLDHDYYTDIITFDQSDGELLEADIFISIDRVKENANEHNASFEHELSRVMVHGLLHLLGYDDKTAEQKKAMREKEEAFISLQKK